MTWQLIADFYSLHWHYLYLNSCGLLSVFEIVNSTEINSGYERWSWQILVLITILILFFFFITQRIFTQGLLNFQIKYFEKKLFFLNQLGLWLLSYFLLHEKQNIDTVNPYYFSWTILCLLLMYDAYVGVDYEFTTIATATDKEDPLYLCYRWLQISIDFLSLSPAADVVNSTRRRRLDDKGGRHVLRR